MSDEELIEKAADAIRWASENGGWADMARAALAVFREHGVEHDRQVAERAWDRCVGEMPIDPDWKNFYSDQNPYRKGQGDD